MHRLLEIFKGKDLSDVNFTEAHATKLNDIQEEATKTEITSTVTSETNKVPSCAAVATYVDSNISGAMDFTAVKDTSASTISITNETEGLCAVRITQMSDGTTQYQSGGIVFNRPKNQKTAFTFNITASENYMVEAWFYNSGTNKLVPTAVKFI